MGERPDLEPPVSCCGRAFTLRRALKSHQSNHVACAACEFSGCKARLRQHLWEAHGIGPQPSELQLMKGTTMEREGKFSVVDEPETKPVPIEERFPDAKVLWSLDGRTGGNASTCQEAGYAVRTGSDNTIVCVDRIKWPSGCQVVLILGRSGSEKSKLLQNMCPTADSSYGRRPSLASEFVHPRWARHRCHTLAGCSWPRVDTRLVSAICSTFDRRSFPCAACTPSAESVETGIPLAIDNCDHLDPSLPAAAQHHWRATSVVMGAERRRQCWLAATSA